MYPRCRAFHDGGAQLPNQPRQACLQPGDADACCLSPAHFTPLQLARVTAYNHDTSLFEFALPDAGACLGLRAFTHLVVRAPGCEHAFNGGGDAERAYTAVSAPSVRGSFTIMVKRYAEWGVPQFAHSYHPPGAVSNYLHSLKLGDAVQMRLNASAHMRVVRNTVRLDVWISIESELESHAFLLGFDCQRLPFGALSVHRVTMICVGAGVAPFVHALHYILGGQGDNNIDANLECTLIYGNRTVRDVLMLPQLLEVRTHCYSLFLAFVNRTFTTAYRRAKLERTITQWARTHAAPRFRLVLAVGSRYAGVRMHRDDCPPKCKIVHPPPLPADWDALAHGACSSHTPLSYNRVSTSRADI